MNQPYLADREPEAWRALNTQAESYRQIQKEGIAQAQHRRIRALLELHGSLSFKEIEDMTGYTMSSISARKSAMADVVEDKGNEHTYTRLSGGRSITRTAKRWKIG